MAGSLRRGRDYQGGMWSGAERCLGVSGASDHKSPQVDLGPGRLHDGTEKRSKGELLFTAHYLAATVARTAKTPFPNYITLTMLGSVLGRKFDSS